MGEARRENITRVRDAIFEASEGSTLDEVMQGIIMAQARIVAHTVDGDEKSAMEILERYRGMQSDALPIYCAETLSPVQ